MALRFGLEFDLKEIEKNSPGLIYTEYFHTMMGRVKLEVRHKPPN